MARRWNQQHVQLITRLNRMLVIDQQPVGHNDTSLESTSAANRSIESNVDSPISREKNRSKVRIMKILLSSPETDHERDNSLNKYVIHLMISRGYCNFIIYYFSAVLSRRR